MVRNEKVNAYIGFSVKSGKIVYGYECVILKKKLFLILCDQGLSPNSMKKVARFAAENSITICVVPDLSVYFGGRAIKCVGIAEEHLASAIEKELNNTVGGSN